MTPPRAVIVERLENTSDHGKQLTRTGERGAIVRFTRPGVAEVLWLTGRRSEIYAGMLEMLT